MKDGLEFHSGRTGQDHSWKTTWQMPCYIRLKRESVCRKQLGSNYGGSNGRRLDRVLGIESFLGGSNLVKFLPLPVHQVGRKCFWKKFKSCCSCLFPHTLLQESKRGGSQGLRDSTLQGEAKMNIREALRWAEHKAKLILFHWSFSKTLLVFFWKIPIQGICPALR